MSSIIATISQIQNHKNLHLIRLDYFGETLTMLSLELPFDVKLNKKVKLGIKPTNIYITKQNLPHFSIANKIPSHIVDIKHGELLSSIKLQHKDTLLEAIITRQSKLEEVYKKGDAVFACMSESDLFIREVLDD